MKHNLFLHCPSQCFIFPEYQFYVHPFRCCYGAPKYYMASEHDSSVLEPKFLWLVLSNHWPLAIIWLQHGFFLQATTLFLTDWRRPLDIERYMQKKFLKADQQHATLFRCYTCTHRREFIFESSHWSLSRYNWNLKT